jgi:hypothetical protein
MYRLNEERALDIGIFKLYNTYGHRWMSLEDTSQVLDNQNTRV